MRSARRLPFLAVLAVLGWMSTGPTLAAGHFTLETERQSLDNGVADGSIERLRYDGGVGDIHYWALVEHGSRFDLDDAWAAVGTRFTLGSRLSLAVEAGGSSTHRVVAKSTARVGASYEAIEGVVFSGGHRRSSYDDDDSSVSDFGIEWYEGPHRLAYTTFIGEVGEGPSGTAHLVGYDYSFTDDAVVGVYAVTGEEAARVSDTAVVLADVEGYGVRGRLPFGDTWHLDAALERMEQGDFYTRRTLRFGVSRRF